MFNQKVKNVEELKEIFQNGLVIETAACIFYLTMVYSMKPGSNKPLKRIIKGIAIEEMGHMISFGNLLKSVGGEPDFLKASPPLPTNLPYEILPYLTVDVGSFSMDAVKVAGMDIERGNFIQKHQIGKERECEKFDLKTLKEFLQKSKIKEERKGQTMCEFLENLRENVKRIDQEIGSKNLFTGDPKLQFSQDCPKLKAVESVVDIDSCVRVIDRIIGESEGKEGNFVNSHYFLFSQLFHGARLVLDKNDNKYFWEEDEGLKPDYSQIFKLKKIKDVNELKEDEKVIWEDFHKTYYEMLKFFNGLYRKEIKIDGRKISKIMKNMDIQGKKLGEMGICPNYNIQKYL